MKTCYTGKMVKVEAESTLSTLLFAIRFVEWTPELSSPGSQKSVLEGLRRLYNEIASGAKGEKP